MTLVPSAETFTPTDSGGYDYEGTYITPGAADVTNAYLGETENVFDTFSGSAITQYLSTLVPSSVVITLNYTFSNADYVQAQPLHANLDVFNTVDDQNTIESNKTNPGNTVVLGQYATGGNGDLQPVAGNFAILVDNNDEFESDVQGGTQSHSVTTFLNASSFTTNNDLFATFQVGAFPLGEDSNSSAIGYPGLTKVSNVTVTITGLAYVNLPVIANVQPAQPVLDDLSITPFSTVTLSDPSNPAGFNDIFTISVEQNGAVSGTLGTLSLPGNAADLKDNGNGVYTLNPNGSSGNRTAELQADLRALVFSPASVQSTQTVQFLLSYGAVGGTEGTTTNSNTSVVVQHDQRTITLSGNAAGTDTTPFTALKGFTVVDPYSGDQVGATISVQSGTGTLSGTGLTANADGTYSLAATTVTQLNSEIQALLFTATPGLVAAGSKTKAEISLAASSADGWTGSAAESVTVTDQAHAPVISGNGALTTHTTGHPFAGAQVTDSNFNSTDTVTIKLSASGANGTLSGTGLTAVGGGTYTLAAGSAATVTSELRALTFTPTSPQPNSSVTTSFTLSDATSIGTEASNTNFSITVNTDAARPVITGSAALTVTAEAPASPFATTTVTDPNANSTDVLTIKVSGAGGVLSGLGLSGSGVQYSLSGSAADVTQELQALVFTPAKQAAGSTGVTHFGLTDMTTPGLNVTNTAFSVTDDDSAVACYLRGTRIATACGEVAVEDLAIGDRLVTASGALERLRWIGRRSYAGRFLAGRRQLLPIVFRAGSLGDGLPRRDLLVSPEHAMFLDGLLIPARCLVNGSTITQERNMDRVDYFHVELETHDVLLAEGAPSESFVDDDSRGMFHNASEFAELYPGPACWSGFCAPRVEHGPELEAIRRRLDVGVGNVEKAA